MVALIGWTPDIAPDASGGIPVCLNIIPSDRGIKPLPGSVNAGVDALASACRGIASAKRTDGGITTVAGTATNLYSLSSTTWSSIDTATLGSEERWDFAQWGNYTIVATPSQTIGYYDGTTYASIAATVKAAHIVSVNGFVLAANYNDGTDDIQDGWICSAYQDAIDWVPAAATQSATGRLLDSPGEITALKRLGPYAVAFQDRAIYVGAYIGPPVVWGFQKVLGEIGCRSPGLIVSNEQYLLFLGADDFYRFDGSNNTPLYAPCSRKVIDTLNLSATYCCQSAWDEERGIAWWFYPTGTSTTADSYVCLHVETGRWGYGEIDVEAVVQFISGGYTYDTIPTEWTYDSMPTYPYDSSFWTGTGKPSLMVVETDHTLYGISGVGVDASMTFSDMGSDQSFTLFSRMYPRFFEQPTTATLTVDAKYSADGSYILATTSDLNDGKFDFLSSAMWHKFTIDLTGSWEMEGFEIDAKPDGRP